MRKYIPTADIPERGNVLQIPIEFTQMLELMDGAARHQFVDAYLHWFNTGALADVGELLNISLGRLIDAQMFAAQRARDAQARARAASAKGVAAKVPKLPPPTR